ncbi:MAG: hypothetical protein WAM14_02455, partial [Candidatus Nitrosopolaris sp.]
SMCSYYMVGGNRLARYPSSWIKESRYKYGSPFLPSFIVSNSLSQPSITSKSRAISPRLTKLSLYELQTVVIRERITTKLRSICATNPLSSLSHIF